MTGDPSKLGSLESWGRYPRGNEQVFNLGWRTDSLLPADRSHTWLCYGEGRSYGDLCLNHGEASLQTRQLNNLISFDRENGRIICESGITLEELLQVTIPAGWFVPVSPGTRYVTVGGAIANDIHGKNHHAAGTFGRHIVSLKLLRSDGVLRNCSLLENADLFSATIAGLGLTGLIVQAEIQLKPIESAWIDSEEVQFHGFDEFFSLSTESSGKYEHTVAWLDCLSSGSNFARGVFIRGNHASAQQVASLNPRARFKALPRTLVSIPFDFPSFTLNKLSIGAFNTLYFHKQLSRTRSRIVHCGPFFYPLDAIRGWNKIYGARGFFQFQCVVPRTDSRQVLTEILRNVVTSGKATFLSVLKEFGDLSSPGMLSFPRPGYTLCLDFPNEGAPTRNLLSRLEQIVMQAGGALYPAKDACMSGDSFAKGFPRLIEFFAHKDPQFSSSFWRRVVQRAGGE